MFTTIALLVMGGAALFKGISNVVSNNNARQNEAKESKYQLDQLKTDTDTSLHTLDAELAASKESDFTQATAIERGATGAFTNNLQSTYLSQLAAESNYMDLLGENQSARGSVKAAAGASGAREDKTLSNVLEKSIAEKETTARTNIDKTRDSAVAGATSNLNESQEQAKNIRKQYDEGSAYMSLFNTKRQGIIETANVKKSYLEDIYNDATTYDWTDFGADFFGFSTPVVDFASDLASKGAF